MTFKVEKQQVIEAIRGRAPGDGVRSEDTTGCYGIMSTVARRLGCTWHAAEHAVNRWEETRQALADENERSLDFTEGKMLEQIRLGDGAMIRFHLATKGKRRGFVERQEVTGADGAAVEVKFVNDWRDTAAHATHGPAADDTESEAD
jgi:hypothetical protein